jgi:Protein of unknown function (DUF3168)
VTVADPIGEIITELRADSGVGSIVGTKVWGAEIPDKASPDPRPYLLVKRVSATRLKRAPVQTVRVSVQCVAKTPRLAAELYGAVSAALHVTGPRGYTSGKIGVYLSTDEGSSPLTDPQMGWPYEQAVFSVWATTGVAA